MMGNLAIEMLFDRDSGDCDSRTELRLWVFDGDMSDRPRRKETNRPNFAGGFRVPTRELGGGICCKFRRVIPRRASQAPVIIGITLSSSSGV
jgi:hypothetical protein